MAGGGLGRESCKVGTLFPLVFFVTMVKGCSDGPAVTAEVDAEIPFIATDGGVLLAVGDGAGVDEGVPMMTLGTIGAVFSGTAAASLWIRTGQLRSKGEWSKFSGLEVSRTSRLTFESFRSTALAQAVHLGRVFPFMGQECAGWLHPQ